MKKGFISITAVLVMSILILMVTYLNHISIIEYLLLSSSLNSSQSQYNAESKIYLSLNDAYYYNEVYPRLVKYFNGASYSLSFKLDQDDLLKTDTNDSVKISFSTKDGRRDFNLVTESICGGIKAKTTGYGSLVNDLYETDEGLRFIPSSLLDDEFDFIDETYLPSDICPRYIEAYDKTDLVMDENRSLKLLSSRPTMTSPFINSLTSPKVFIVSRNGDKEYTFTVKSDMTLDGIIYVDGDLIVDNNFTLNGLLFIKDGNLVINQGGTLTVKGSVISNNLNNINLEDENLNIIFNKTNLYKYGVLVPGFIDIKIKNIKTD